MKMTAGRLARYFLAAMLACVFVFAVGKIYRQLTEEHRAQKEFQAIADAVRTAEAQIAAPAAESSAEDEPILPQYAGLHERNEDFFGWLRIEGTPIDYPVMYTPEDPEYYLHRGFDGAPLTCGVPFVDGACPAEGNYYLIHGHHMKNGTMFGTLPRYRQYSYWQEHRFLTFDTRMESRSYEIMAAFPASADEGADGGTFQYLEYADLTQPQRFTEFVEGVRSAALYDTGVTAQPGDELIALSTCSYHTENGRFVVVAKRID